MIKDAANFLLARALQFRKPLIFASMALTLFAVTRAAAQAEPLAQTVPVKTFNTQVFVKEQMKLFAVSGNFTLADDSDGIKPASEDTTLQVGNFVFVIPAGSFRPTWSRGFVFTRAAADVNVEIVLQPLGNGTYDFVAVVKGAVPAADPLNVVLMLGNDRGSSVVKSSLMVTRTADLR